VTLRASRRPASPSEQTPHGLGETVAQQPVEDGLSRRNNRHRRHAIKMLMVEVGKTTCGRAHEGGAGSIREFRRSDERNERRIGMTQSSFVNPNGLPPTTRSFSALATWELWRGRSSAEMPEYDITGPPRIAWGRWGSENTTL